MAKKKLTNDQIRAALINSRGLTTLAADALGVDWKTIQRYIVASQPLQDLIQVMRHKRTQFAKSKLDEAIMRGESWAIMFTLKNKVDPDAEFVGERNTTAIDTAPGLEITIRKASDATGTAGNNNQ
jgi:hypothetical protein